VQTAVYWAGFKLNYRSGIIRMANTAQSKKRARQAEARQDINKARRSRIRTFLRKVEEALASGQQTAAAEALKNAQPELARGVTKGVMHKNTVARKMSRLASRVKALGAAASA
jgi:small subunit ribosomal protein S20